MLGNKLTPTQEYTFIATCRLVGYFLFLILVMQGLYVVAEHYGRKTFCEGGPVENAQLVLLALGTFLFGIQSFFFKKYRALLLGLSSLCAFAFCRELDAFWDKRLPVIGWKFAFLFPLAAGGYALSQWKEFKKNLMWFLSSPAFYLMVTAMMIIGPVAQCVGHKPMIKNAVGVTVDLYTSNQNIRDLEDAHVDISLNIDIRSIRRLFEESTEFMGYTLIILSAIELFFLLRKKR